MVIAIRSTTIGAFASRSEAEQAVDVLLIAKFDPDQIGMVIPDEGILTSGSVESRPITLWVGAMFRTLIGVEIPEEEVSYYEEALEEGRTLVMVRSGDRYPEAMDILYRSGGTYMAAF